MIYFPEFNKSYGPLLAQCDVRRAYETYLALKAIEWEKQKKAHQHVIAEVERMMAIDRATAVDSEVILQELGYLPKPKGGSPRRRGVPELDDL